MKVGVYMQKILSPQELSTHLNNFRETLKSFDYTSLGNLRFLNAQAVYSYIENVENNAFESHYNELQERLDILQPYLPFLSSERAKNFLIQISKVTSDEGVEKLKEKYMDKLRMDFIHTTNKITSDED